MSDLEKVESYDDLTHKQWIALGTKLGGLNVVKAVLQGSVALTVEHHRFLWTLKPLKITGTGNRSRISVRGFCEQAKVWIHPDFVEFILEAAKSEAFQLSSRPYGYADLIFRPKPGNEKIRSELPEEHVFEQVEEFLALLLILLNQETDNRSRFLKAEGSNIFYVRGREGNVYVVNVYWHSNETKWHIVAYDLHFEPWGFGDRVFSASDLKD